MYRIWLAILIGLSLSPHLQADETAPLRIVYYDNYAPYSWLDDSGRMRGIFIDIIDEIIGARMNKPVKHLGFPWARAQQYVRTGEFDAMIAPKTSERASYTHFSGQPVLIGRMAMFTRASHPQMRHLRNTRSLDDIRAFNFVTQLGDGWAGENLEAMEVQYVADLDTVLKMLDIGRADLFIEASLVTHWNLRNLDLADSITEVDGVTIEETPYHLMISKKSSQQLLQAFDRHIRAFTEDGGLTRLLEKYR